MMLIPSSKHPITMYIERAMNEDIPFDFWPTIGTSIVVGILSGIAYVSGSLELAPDNLALGIFYAVCSYGINAALNAPWAKQLIELGLDHIYTPEEFKPYIPAKYSKKFWAFLMSVLTSFGLSSTLPYLALGENTKSAIWITAINIVINSIAHAKSFSIALSSENFMFHQSITQNLIRLGKKIFSDQQAKENYLKKQKNNFILNELHEIILKNVGTVISSNFDKKPLLNALEQFSYTPPRSTAYNFTRNFTALIVTVVAFASFAGWVTGGYNTLVQWTADAIAGLMLSSFANLFYLYLVGVLTFDIIASKTIDTCADIHKNGLQETIKSQYWFEIHKKLLGCMLVALLIMAAASYPSSIYLIQVNFAILGWNALIKPFKYITYPTSGIFNVVNIPDLLKTTSQVIEFAKLKRKGEQIPLLEDPKQPGEISAAEKLVTEYKASRVNTRLCRLDKVELLKWVVVSTSESAQKDQIITQLSEDRITSTAELDNFLKHRVSPAYYNSRAATFSGRAVDRITETLRCTPVVANYSPVSI